MFCLRVYSATYGFLSGPENMLSIIGVNHLPNNRHVNGTFPGSQSVDAVKLVGPSHAIRDEVPIVVAHVRDTLGLFESGFAFLQASRQGLAFFLGAFALRDISDYTDVLEVAEVVSSGMRNHVEELDCAVSHENSMLDIQVHGVLRGTIPKLLQAVSVLGVNSVEYHIERRIRSSCEAQNPVRFVRPNEFATGDLPSKSSRMT